MPKIVPISEELAKLSEFEIFWRCYPRKKGKLDAMKAWEQVAKHRPPLEAILAAVNTAIQSGEWNDPHFTPWPGTWLRRGQFLDED